MAGLRKDQQNTFPEGQGINKKCKSESVDDNVGEIGLEKASRKSSLWLKIIGKEDVELHKV